MSTANIYEIDPVLSSLQSLEEAMLSRILVEPGELDRLVADSVEGSSWRTVWLGRLFDLLRSWSSSTPPRETDLPALIAHFNRNAEQIHLHSDPVYTTQAYPSHGSAHARLHNGLAYLASISSYTGYTFDWLYTEWRRRTLEERIRESAEQLRLLPDRAGQLSADELLARAEGMVSVLAGTAVPSRMTTAQQSALRSADRLARRRAQRDEGGCEGIRTGLSCLDEGQGSNDGIRFLKRKEVHLVAARPGQGKTSLAINIVRSALKGGESVLFFSLEMSEEQLADKFIALEADVSTRALEDATWSDAEGRRMDHFLSEVYPTWHLSIDDTAEMSPEQALSKARRVAAQLRREGRRLDLVCLDYVQLLSGRPGEEERIRLGRASMIMKQLAKTLDVAVLLVAQLNRDTDKRKDRRALMSDLKGSGQLEQDAYNILMIYREDVESKESEAEINVIKARGGGLGTYRCMWHGPTQRFSDLSHRTRRW